MVRFEASKVCSSAADMAFNYLIDVSRLNNRGVQKLFLLGNNNRMILSVTRANAVRTLYQAGVEGNQVHEHATPELLLEQASDNLQFWKFDCGIDEQLD